MREVKKMDGSVGFDVVIVCTSTVMQENFWQDRLEKTTGQVAVKDAVILVVHEDWAADGAGNGLGTLYAYTKARAKAKAKGIDLDQKLESGSSVAMYHTAGKGTRLAPLPGAENNNKPGVKLPSLLEVDGVKTELTILEAVIKQTNSYAPSRKARCSVFWGDQIFVPLAGTPESGKHHADILGMLGPMPSAEEWAAKGLEKYGLIAVNEAGDAAQVEKVTFEQATDLLSSFGTVSSVGPSLGSFSVSAALLKGLLEEFASELSGKEAKFDSDPDFWMPLTLSLESYVKIMGTKEVTSDVATKHHARMAAFKTKFLDAQTDKAVGMFGCIDAGTICYWWDYGQLKLYKKNNLLATASSAEAKALHQFMRIDSKSRVQHSQVAATTDKGSVVLNSKVAEGSIKGSLLSSVQVEDLQVKDCLLINVTAKKVKGEGLILYNVVDDSEEGLCLEEGDVRVNVYMPEKEKLVMKSNVSIDGGKVFKTKMDINPFSFQDVYKMNGAVDVSAAKALQQAAAAELVAKMEFPVIEEPTSPTTRSKRQRVA